MNFPEICIKRPVFTWVLTLIMIMLGLVTGDRLQLRQDPKVGRNRITIEMNYYGSGPEIVENQVTSVLEEAIAGVEGIESIESSSESEKSKISLEIAEGMSVETAANEVRDRLSKWRDRLPQDAQEAILTKAGSSDKSTVTLALVSDKMSESELYAYANNEIKNSLEAVPGVAKIDVYGAGEFQISINLDPQKMAFYNLTVIDVANALKKQNVESPAGKIINKDREYVVTTVADLQSPEEFQNIPIVNKKNMIVKLRDVGTARLDKSNKRILSRFNGEKVVTISVISQSSSNPIQVARGIKKKYEEIVKQLPSSMKFSIAYDSTTFIERSLNEVYHTILESILLVVIVVFLFLQSVRAALIPLITVPISLVGALFIMYLCDFTINNMTLMSMVLAIGLVVDDAIVILENVHKYIEKGLSPMQAAIEGTKEVSFAVIAMTLTLCAVYAPVALAQGEMGRYLKEFSVTLAGAVLLSGFVALTLSPMMCSRTLSSRKTKQTSRTALRGKRWGQLKAAMNVISRALETSELIKRTEEKYAKYLDVALARRHKVVIWATIFSAFGYLVYIFMPSEQRPYQDVGMFGFEGHAPQMATLQFTQRYVDAIDKVISEVPEIEARNYIITNPTFEGVALIKDKCGRSSEDVMQEVSLKCEKVSGVDVKFRSGRDGADESSKTVFCVIRGNKSHRELRGLVSSFVAELYATGCIQSVRTTARNEAEDYTIEVLRDKASMLNIEPRTISDTIAGLMQGRVATKFKKDNKRYDVKTEVEEHYKKSPEQLSDIYVKTTTEREELLVPIAELISISARSGPVSIHRYNRTRANTVIGLLNSSVSLGDAIEIFRDTAKKTLPDDAFIEFIGSTKQYLSESNTMALIFLMALSFIYLVMAAQFESWRGPFVIMLTVPLALVGGVLTLASIGSTINMFSNIGFLTLIGLITKHGILIVDFANKLVSAGSTPVDAIKESARRRLRPILMTTLAMILGAMPLAFASGAGSEVRIPLGAVITGGLAVGTLFTIFVIPVIYTYVVSSGGRKKTKKIPKLA
ncbi:MAG: efflux RND transporter permease subunit [Holosporales bacterium]|jgi:multidrug efflux pump|nr:efflux RND transporter permease subunit [Holosporales bacterium]